jgi:anti-sigma factor RsiW
MRCEEFAANLEAWLDGELAAEAATATAAHAAGCPACAEVLAARLRLRAALREAAAATPPADLRAAILAAAAAEGPTQRRRWRPLAVAGLAAAALLLVALGLRGLLGRDAPRTQHGCMVIAYLDGAYEEAGALRAGELKLTAGPGARSASDPTTIERGKR